MNQTIYKMAGREDPFARVPKAMLDDDRISWQAKGILAYLVGKKDGWKMRIADLVKRGTAGKCAVRAALNELRAFGYADFVRLRAEKGRIGECVWKISDSPVFSPRAGFPDVDKPDVENRHGSKNELGSKRAAVSVSQESKESEETSAIADAPVFAAQWKPNLGTKAEKLAKLRNPTDFPTERAFDAVVASDGLDNIAEYRPDLYSTLCDAKWRQWNDGLRKWVPIHDWRRYINAFNDKLSPGGGF